MTSLDDLDRLLPAWFEAEADAHAPDHLADVVIARVARTGRRPGWLIPGRWFPMQATMRLAAIPRSAALFGALLLLLLLLLLAVAQLGASRRLPAPFGPAQTGRVAFDSKGQVFTVNADGSDVRQVVRDARFDLSPTWSRDGTRLVYWSAPGPGAPLKNQITDAQLVMMDANGAQPRILIDHVAAPGLIVSWSGDGQHIAITTTVDGTSRLVIVNADGSGSTAVPSVAGGASNPAWSPDGLTVAYSGPDGLYVVGVDGKDPHAIWKPADQSFGGPNPVWAPDGHHLAFFAPGPSTLDIWVVDPDGRHPRNLTDNAVDEYTPAWSPRSDRLAFLRHVSDGPANQIVIVDPDGSHEITPPHPLTDGGQLEWTPDGRALVAFLADATTDQELVLVPADGREPVVRIPSPDDWGWSSIQRLGG
jgi:TolB protein